MRSGRLRHRIVIQELGAGSPRQSSSGERGDAWQAFKTVRAWIRQLAGRDLEAAQQRHAEVSVEIRIRHVAGVAAGMRVLHQSTYYPVLAVWDPELREEELVLGCSAGVINPAVAS